MTLRVLLQTNPALFRVSKPGIDAATAVPDDCLIDSSDRNTMVITAGRLLVASGTTNVPFGVTLPSVPVVDLQSMDSSNSSMVPYREYGFAKPNIACTPSLTGLQFSNSGPASWVVYVVIAKTLT